MVCGTGMPSTVLTVWQAPGGVRVAVSAAQVDGIRRRVRQGRVARPCRRSVTLPVSNRPQGNNSDPALCSAGQRLVRRRRAPHPSVSPQICWQARCSVSRRACSACRAAVVAAGTARGGPSAARCDRDRRLPGTTGPQSAPCRPADAKARSCRAYQAVAEAVGTAACGGHRQLGPGTSSLSRASHLTECAPAANWRTCRRHPMLGDIGPAMIT